MVSLALHARCGDQRQPFFQIDLVPNGAAHFARSRRAQRAELEYKGRHLIVCQGLMMYDRRNRPRFG